MSAEVESRLASGPRHNLPDGLSSFVGRDLEIAEAAGLLERSRLVTLVGAGGVGKTRLALVLASHVLSQYPGGAWFVELAPLADASLLHRAVASALSLQEQPGRPLIATLVDALNAERTLLVLDNCEHLVRGCAEVTEQLLRSCPRLTILATSRELLGITGEVTRRVPSLRVPQPPPPPPELLNQYEAVRLFVDRAVAVQPNFRVTNQNAPVVAELCWRVDGIALAIELAAAWVRVLSPEQILARVNDSLKLLVGGSRTAPARQQTLRATIEWSYRLLDRSERQLFQRLGVFAGGWTLEAAEGICADDTLPIDEVLGLLAGLVDKSLVAAEFQDDTGAVRYRLLELLRAYSLQNASEAGDLARLRQRHRDWFLAQAERVPAEMLNPLHIAELERERDNVRAALRWTIAAGDTAHGLRLANAMWGVWYVRGYYSEGRTWIAEILGLSDGGEASSGRARALAAEGHLAYCQGDFAAADVLLKTAKSTASDAGDQQTVAIVLQFLGNLARGRGNLRQAQELYTLAYELNKRLQSPIWEAMTLVGQGQVAADQGNHIDAERFATESLALCNRAGHTWGAARSLWILGRVASGRREFAAAQQLLQSCMSCQRDIGDRQGLVWAWLDLAQNAADASDLASAADYLASGISLARELGDRLSVAKAVEGVAALVVRHSPESTIRLAGAASVLRASIGTTQVPTSRGSLADAIDTARHALGGGAHEAAWASGSAMSIEQAVDLALKVLSDARGHTQPAGPRAPSAAQPLTPREREVARLVAEGLTDRHIAERLVITEGTAGVHVAHILAKLEFHSRAQIAAWVIEHGLQSAPTAERRQVQA